MQNVFVPSLISWTIGQDKATVLDVQKMKLKKLADAKDLISFN